MPGTIGILGAGLAILMLVIAVTDWHSFIIPDALSAAGLCLGVIYAAVQEPAGMLLAVAVAIVRGAALALVFLAIRNAYGRIRRRDLPGLRAPGSTGRSCR